MAQALGVRLEARGANMSEHLKVRIGITTKNRPDYLPRCLNSCLAQTYGPKEVVVWDNSDDPEALRKNKEVAAAFPAVRWIRPDVQKSLIETRAQMMSEPGCDLFCSIDDDGWFMGTDELALAVREFESDQNCAGVAFDILSPDRPSSVARNPPQPTMHFVGCGHMLRREMAEAVGYYADFPGRYGSEEKDLCIRFMDRGWNMRFLPGVHVWHDKTSIGRDWGEQHRSGTLNDLIFGFLRCPMPDLIYYLPGKAVNLVLWGLKGTSKERWSGFLGAWDFVKCAPRYWKKRQPVTRSTFREFFAAGRSGKEKPRDWEGKER
jgi:glycosyltransferase involved in cell wall biosynthesis